MSESKRTLHRTQLNDALGKYHPAVNAAVPRGGWAKSIREALGMTHAQVAARLKVSRQSVQDLEQAEAKRRITVESLDRLAAAMGCRVVYALVPEGGSLDAVREHQARAVAEKLLSASDHSMRLEGQGVSKGERHRQLEQLVDSLLRGSPRKLWK